DMIADIDLIKEQIEKAEAQIEVKKAEYEAAKEKEDTLYEAMKQRVKYMYEQGETSYLQILLTASNYSDVLSKAQYAEQIYEYDRNKLEEYIEAKKAADTAKKQLEEEKAELETAKYELEEEQKAMEEVLAQYKAKYSDYEVKLAKAKQDAAIYTAQIKSQQSSMAALQKQIESKQNEVNETKKAAQAAREAEEAERKRQAEEAAEKSKSESGGGGGDSGESSQSGGSKNSSPPPAPSGGGSGSNIASYACQFVGNPYVSGGTSLTNGADCSGFVFSVYKAFGISVPRTSWEQGNYGREVSYSEAQPGDVIYYGGHVGIYIGGGQIVHASTQKTGIKYSSAMYRPIICVRRFV
ncbi:MAG: NlpC/P60 family protein, partial [Butyrivibrio sp.]|nr:NlpC/P60 family protein [Butyrivibrio sp.]